MPRKPAAQRHADSAPAPAPGSESRDRTDPDVGAEPLDVLIAFHHPTRRWLAEILGVEGPASVGRLAARTGLAAGSVSHHLKSLHRQGFIEPAPELARDTRESWWRAVPRPVRWSVDDFAPGSAERRVADAAEAENFRHQVRAVQQWLAAGAREVDESWRRAATSSDTMVSATVDQLADLGERLAGVVAQWSAECQTAPDDGAERRPVRVIARAFPSGPVRP